MRVKILVFALFVIFGFNCIFAQSPEEMLKANLKNISIPDEGIKSFCLDLTISLSGDDYPIQIRYKDGKVAFNCLDKDKTPIVSARNSDVILNDISNGRVCLFQKNILVLSVTYENQRLDASLNIHQPTGQEKENAIKVDFLALAQQGNREMKVTEKNGLIIISGKTA